VSGGVGGVYQDSRLCDSEQRKSVEQKTEIEEYHKGEGGPMRSGD
jgi:hypothetical protein